MVVRICGDSSFSSGSCSAHGEFIHGGVSHHDHAFLAELSNNSRIEERNIAVEDVRGSGGFNSFGRVIVFGKVRDTFEVFVFFDFFDLASFFSRLFKTGCFKRVAGIV